MPDLTLWGLFIVASVVLTPGPAVLFIVARSVEQGRAAGLVSVLGIYLGTTVHIIAAAVGLSALVTRLRDHQVSRRRLSHLDWHPHPLGQGPRSRSACSAD
jgi:arginine exporter protein ArgO